MTVEDGVMMGPEGIIISAIETIKEIYKQYWEFMIDKDEAGLGDSSVDGLGQISHLSENADYCGDTVLCRRGVPDHR